MYIIRNADGKIPSNEEVSFNRYICICWVKWETLFFERRSRICKDTSHTCTQSHHIKYTLFAHCRNSSIEKRHRDSKIKQQKNREKCTQRNKTTKIRPKCGQKNSVQIFEVSLWVYVCSKLCVRVLCILNKGTKIENNAFFVCGLLHYSGGV